MGVVTVSWTEPDGAEKTDYSPMFEIWATGGQIHMAEKVEVGTDLQVLMEDKTVLRGRVEKRAADTGFGYIVDVAMSPRRVWTSGIRRLYHSDQPARDLATLSLPTLLPM